MCMYKKDAFNAKKRYNYLQDLGTQGAKYRINEAILLITWIKPRYLTIIPRARMGSESIAHEADSRMGFWLREFRELKNLAS